MLTSTVAMVLEILLCGFQTVLWLLILVFTIFGFTWFSIDTFQSVFGVTIFLVFLSYNLGVIFDRIWDKLLGDQDDKLRFKFFNDHEDFYKTRFKVFNSKDLNKSIEFLEYTRSRKRITRSSIFNFILITLCTIVFIITQVDTIGEQLTKQLFYFVVCLGSLLTYLSIIAWRKTSITYYKQIHEVGERLQDMDFNVNQSAT